MNRMPNPMHSPADQRHGAALDELAGRLDGDLFRDDAMRRIYATDASEYQEMPLAVALPESEGDIQKLLEFASQRGLGLIPRAAGTSLAGQVVGNGIVVDIGRHLNRIMDYDPERRRVRVQPGVIRDDLNRFLKPHGVFYTPETSTANRAMIGGMVGNNSCGANSIVYGTVREHLVSARGFLSDGSEVTFGPLTRDGFAAKCAAPDSLETRIYIFVRDLLADAANRSLIRENYPKSTVTRRNTGYALDQLMDCEVFRPSSDQPFNLCRLLAGSEGTLFLGVEFELNCEPLPPPGALMCAHFATINDSLKATVIAMRHQPFGCELIDRHILECTKSNLTHARNRFFVQGDPGAILVIEIRKRERADIEQIMRSIEDDFRAADLGYAFPVLWGDDCNRVWDLRRAGQGLMNIVEGDAKPREIVEDTAVAVEDLPAYIGEFDALMKEKYGIHCVYYAHAGAGELHTRPLFNLKTPEGLAMFRNIATDVAALVKKYRGSLSGEHGDGRLRGEFIKSMVGEECYMMMRRVKEVFDPNGVFNPGKIIDTPPMDTHLRHELGHVETDIGTVFDFSSTRGVLRAAEACTGVGECRKSSLSGGTMCPSYMATRNEQDSTRARANMLRHMLTHPRDATNPWDSAGIRGVMDLCLSCKACKSECPSNVDMTRLKAEWQHHYNDTHGIPLRSQVVARFAEGARLASWFPGFYNAVFQTPLFRRVIHRLIGFHPERTMPRLNAMPLRRWAAGRKPLAPLRRNIGRVHFFCDEFTNYNDLDAGIAAVELLELLGYGVVFHGHRESGRAALSKGLLRRAKGIAEANVRLLSPVVSADEPLIGIEPSALLGFRDEYPALVDPALRESARKLATNCLLLDEFIVREAKAGRIDKSLFTRETQTVHVHGHCHQKALASISPTLEMLSLPENYTVREIPSGCCGMAGSFGFEREHYRVSMDIGELVLFPVARMLDPAALIAAAGTSCRHQIHDGTGRLALHPARILRNAILC